MAKYLYEAGKGPHPETAKLDAALKEYMAKKEEE